MFVEKFNGKNNHERSDSKQQRQRLWLKDRKLRATVPQPSFINHHHHHHHCLCQTTATATHDNATTTHCWRAGYRPCRPVHWTYCGLGERNRLLLSFPLSFTLSFPLLLLTTFIVVRFFPHLSRLPTRAVSSWEPRSTMPCGITTW